jgi:hypothetical protein
MGGVAEKGATAAVAVLANCSHALKSHWGHGSTEPTQT